LVYLYPWTNSVEYQPFRKLKDCRNNEFKEAVLYFLECLEITPDTVKYTKEWKSNINLIKKELFILY